MWAQAHLVLSLGGWWVVATPVLQASVSLHSLLVERARVCVMQAPSAEHSPAGKARTPSTCGQGVCLEQACGAHQRLYTSGQETVPCPPIPL